jgi:uncharacterized membrane protein
MLSHNTQRYLFIDMLRFIAVVFMVQGHTFDALLEGSVRQASWFYVYDFFHGFVAPMFLFASGVAFGVSTFKKWEDHISFSHPVRKRLGRFIGLIAIGYALHLPFFSLFKLIRESTPQDIASFLQVDALQCIGVTLLAIQLLVLFLKKRDRFIVVIAIAAPLIVICSALVWNISFIKVFPLWLASYCNAENGSWFPLFPWSGYLLFGVVFGYIFVEAAERQRTLILMKRTILSGVALIVVCVAIARMPFHVYPNHDFWKVNPAMLLIRLGFILLVTSGLFFLERSVTISSRIPTILGRESLAIYVVHLVIVYGSALNNGLQQYLGGTLTVPQATIAFLIIFFTMCMFAILWNTLRRNHQKKSVVVKFALSAAFILLFIIRPY